MFLYQRQQPLNQKYALMHFSNILSITCIYKAQNVCYLVIVYSRLRSGADRERFCELSRVWGATFGGGVHLVLTNRIGCSHRVNVTTRSFRCDWLDRDGRRTRASRFRRGVAR